MTTPAAAPARLRPQSIEALLNPRNVVLVGATDRPGHWSGRVIHNLERFGFPGSVFLVNPTKTTLWGRNVFPDIASLPESPDHLALFVPAEVSIEVLETAGALGTRGATLYAAGFGEGGEPEGRSRAETLARLLEQGGIAAAGPNCMGVASAHSRLVTIPDENLSLLEPGPVAVLTQSGMLCSTFARALSARGLGPAYLISCGNQTGLTFADYIRHMAEDDAVRVVICYVEALKSPEDFFAAVRLMRERGKEVIVLKAGASEAGRAATLAHTGALAGSNAVFDVMAREAGVVRVDALEETIEAAEFLSHAARMKGPRGAFVSNSGAMKTLMTDTAAAVGLSIPPLSEATRQELARVLGTDADISNPLDTKKTLPTDAYIACIKALRNSGDVDFVLAIEEIPASAAIKRKVDNLTALDALVAGSGPDVPVATLSPLTFPATPYMDQLRTELEHLPMLRDMGKSFRALAAIAGPDGSSQASSGASEAAPASGIKALSEAESKKLLARHGIRGVPETVVQTPEDAVRAAEAMGYPVVLKAVSSAIPHKSDFGLVHLALGAPGAVESAAHDIVARSRELEAPLEGILVAKHLSGGVEMVIGVHRDPEFGPVVMVGMGGVWLEILKDVAFAPIDLDRDRALRAIASTRASTLLNGYRGAPRADIEALADAMVALGRMAADLGPELGGVDVNPIMVLAEGQGAFALDGLVLLHR